MSTMRKPNSQKQFRKTKQLANIMGKISELRNIENRDAKMKNPAIHDFVTLLFVYNDILKVSATKETRNTKMQKIKTDFCDEQGRIRKNGHFFEKNPYLTSTYKFVCHIIEYINKQNHNPKHTNFLN